MMFSDEEQIVHENEAFVFVCEDESRLDKLISDNCEITRSAAAKLIDSQNVKIGGKIVTKKSLKPSLGTTVEVFLPPPAPCAALPQDIPVDIVYEDEDIIIVNKPQGMVVHPASGNPDGTLVNALMFHCNGRLSSINGVIRPGIVHRIDKDTSGLLVVAKTDFAHISLSEQIKEHSFKRVYNAIITGSLKEKSGTVSLPIGRHPTHRKKMAVTNKNSREAITHYKTLELYRGFSFVELTLETGRTHQIRVHLSHLGHPVLGDPLYSPQNGKNSFGLCGQALHARILGIVHPRTGDYMEFSAPLPAHIQKTIDILRSQNNIYN